MKKGLFFSIIAFLALVATSCHSTDGWSVTGKIGDAAGKTLLLESVNNGRWTVLDSIAIASDGGFSFKQDRAAYPDIYRLTLDGRSLYFPVDSIDNITVDADFATFDHAAKISGSSSADLMQRVNDLIAAAVGPDGKVVASQDSLLKREIAQLLQADWGGIVAYYTINKTLGNAPLFDPANNFDRRVIGAVANAYTVRKPNDPRTELLRKMSLTHRRMYDTPATDDPIYVEAVPFMEISLIDQNGKKRSLTEEWQKGKVMVLNFTLYGTDESPAYNAVLSQVYNRYKDSGLEIYQVVCDDDEFTWQQAAKNIPWISVFNSPTEGGRTLLRYNVTTVPTTFVIDRSGDNVERVEDVNDLKNIVAKFI